MTTSGTFVVPSVGKITVPAASIIPQGVGAPPPPGLDPKKGKLMCIKVRMLDDTVGVFHLGHKALGQALFEEVCRHLNLLECDYFGLEFLDCFGNRCWLDKEKSILKQITIARSDARFYFVLKFYTPTPADLEEEYTRYLFALQIKRDLSSGQFVCNENTAALMASYIVQSECGDFSPVDYQDHSYLSPVRFVPNQSDEFEKKVMENHKRLIGMSPSESDLALLETARRSEFYGVRFHPARDIEGTTVALAVLHLGFRVFHHLTCVNTFSWAKLRKLSFKRKKLFIKLLPESCTYYKDTIEFSFDTRNECKMFWKKAVEHHAFFRCSETVPTSRQQSKFFTKGSSFRYCGRTQKQLIDYVREHHKRREPFTRPLLSSKTKNVNGERLLPTPMSSLPGTLERGGENGGLSKNRVVFAPPVGISSYYQQPAADENSGFQMPQPAEFGAATASYNENMQSDYDSSKTTRWQQYVDSNNEENSTTTTSTTPMPPVIIPPTPDTPQLKRKAVGKVGSTGTGQQQHQHQSMAPNRQQITFHFPVTQISPDSPSSSSAENIGLRRRDLPRPDSGIIIHHHQSVPEDQQQQCQMSQEWASPPSPQLPPLSPGVDGDGAGLEEDNVSEDSYHLAEHELLLMERQQQRGEPYLSTSLPASALRPKVGGDDGTTKHDGWTTYCVAAEDHQVPAVAVVPDGPPKGAASLDLVFPSNSAPVQGFEHYDQRRAAPMDRGGEGEESPTTFRSPPGSTTTRGLSRPLPGRVIPTNKGPVIVARTKPIPPPKPKMGLGNLDRTTTSTTRGEYTGSGAAAIVSPPSTQPVVVSHSTITTMEVTTRKLIDVHQEPVVTKASDFEEEAKCKSAATPVSGGGGSKKVAFFFPTASADVMPKKPGQEASSSSAASLPSTTTKHSPTPPGIPPSVVFPPEPDVVAAATVVSAPSRSVPTIEVESEERPDIKHKIVNGDIPYILHVRHVKRSPAAAVESASSAAGSGSSVTFSTFKEPHAVKTVSEQVAAEIATSTTAGGGGSSSRSRGVGGAEPSVVVSSSKGSSSSENRRSVSVGRRKSFDLVPRKRLPSPASFSSQDHSVSPDSEHDVTGFVTKYRGGGGGTIPTTSKEKSIKPGDRKHYSLSKRTDPRRMTQPVAPRPMVIKPKPARSQPCITAGEGGGGDEDSGDDEEEVVSMGAPSLHEGMDLLERMMDHDESVVDLEMTQELQQRRASVAAASNEDAPPPFIDDRSSSDSPASAIYDNLPPMTKKSAGCKNTSATDLRR